MRVVVIGNVSLDAVQFTDPLNPRLGMVVKKRVPGGAAFYSALSFANLGCEVVLVSRVGGDYPEAYVDELREAGVILSCFKVIEGEETTSFKRINQRDREITECKEGASTRLRLRDVPKKYYEPDLLYISPIEPVLQERFIVKMRARKVAIDTHIEYLRSYSSRKRLVGLLGNVNYFFPNEREARVWSFSDRKAGVIKLSYFKSREKFLPHIAKTISQSGPELVVIKRGGAGSIVYDKKANRYYLSPAIPYPQISCDAEPTGAGDCFAAGFLYGLLFDAGESSLKNALMYGNAAASVALEGVGAFPLFHVTKGELVKRASDWSEFCGKSLNWVNE